MKPPYAIGSVPSLSGHAVAYRWRSLPRVRRHRANKPQGSSERVLPWQITMDQLIFASFCHNNIGEKPTVILYTNMYRHAGIPKPHSYRCMYACVYGHHVHIAEYIDVCIYVCMAITYIYLVAEYGSTGGGCQSCSWSAKQGKKYSPVPVRA